MIGIILASVFGIAFIAWVWYEMKHPYDYEDEHKEAEDFRRSNV